MFQYTTETILNDASRIKTINMSDGTTTNPNALIIDGVNLFRSEFITKVTKRAYQAAVKEVLVIKPAAVSGIVKGTVYRLMITLYQEGLVSSNYADAQMRHFKPFFFEVTATSTSANDLFDAFADVVKKQMSLTDFKNYFVCSIDSSHILTFTAQDVYARFKELRIDSVPIATVNTSNIGNAATGFQDYDEVFAVDRDGMKAIASAKGSFTEGSEGAGTVARLIKNLRVPTDANTDPFGIDTGGKPIPGGQYDQYLIEYTTDRRHIGGQVMGALDKSVTNHVIFAEASVGSPTVSSALNTALTAVIPSGVTIEVVSYSTPITAKNPKEISKQ